MPKRNKHQRPKDVNQWAHDIVRTSTDPAGMSLPSKEQVSALMAQLGRKGGKIGGKRRLQTMTPKQRAEVARKAAEARWKRKEE